MIFTMIFTIFNRIIATIFVATLFVTFTSSAQGGANLEFPFGLHFNTLKPTAQGAHKDGSRLGLSAGVIANLGANEMFKFRTGLLYQAGGGKISFDSLGLWLQTYADDSSLVSGKITYKLSRLEVPLGIQFRWHAIPLGNSYLRPWLTACPLGFSVRMRSRADVPDQGAANLPIRQDVRFLALNYAYGIGTDYQLGENLAGFFGIELGGSYTRIVKVPGARQRYFGIKLGVRLE